MPYGEGATIPLVLGDRQQSRKSLGLIHDQYTKQMTDGTKEKFVMTLQRYCPQCGHELEMRRVDGADRQTCTQTNCDYVHWDNPVPVVAGVIVHKNGLLLARNRLWPLGRFSLITGYVDRQESPQNAVRRELHEELGLTADSVRFIGHYLFNEKNQLIIAYALEAHGELKLGEEIAELRSVPINALVHYDFSPFEITRAIVHDWLTSATDLTPTPRTPGCRE